MMNKADQAPVAPECTPPDMPKKAYDGSTGTKTLFQTLGMTTDFQLPGTVYTSAALCGILFEYHTCLEWLTRCGEAYVRLLINIVVQVFLLCAVYQIDRWQMDVIDGGTDCYQHTFAFSFFCLWIFFATVLTEIFETCQMAEVILKQIPTVDGQSKSLQYMIEDGEPILKSGGMSVARKVCTGLFVLMPKFAIGISMLIIGAIFLTSASSNTDILLNSLAAVFVIEVDELIFAFMTPAYMRNLIESLPPFGGESQRISFGWKLFVDTSIIWKSLLSVILVVFFRQVATKCTQDPCTGAKRTCPAIPFFTE